MQFVSYPKCTTCKKAKAWLDEKEINYEFKDIKTENPTVEELKEWHRKSGLVLKKFFNTSGTKYKELGLSKKIGDMSEEDQLEILASDGMLVKRPIFVGKDYVLVGFKEDEWEEFIK